MAFRAFKGDEPSALLAVRRLLLGIYFLGVLGIATELGLIGHYEDSWQWAPLVLLALASISCALWWLKPSPGTFRLFRGIAMLLILGGCVGIFLHLKGNAEFEREMIPSIGGFALLWESSRGATPALAPGALIQLGLLGWAATIRHPGFR